MFRLAQSHRSNILSCVSLADGELSRVTHTSGICNCETRLAYEAVRLKANWSGDAQRSFVCICSYGVRYFTVPYTDCPCNLAWYSADEVISMYSRFTGPHVIQKHYTPTFCLLDTLHVTAKLKYETCQPSTFFLPMNVIVPC